MATKIQLRRDSEANWTTADPVLAEGEVGVNLDTSQLKVGDGLTPWSGLPYATGDAAYWNRIGTVLTPLFVGDTLQIDEIDAGVYNIDNLPALP